MQTSPMSTNNRIKIITALATLAPLAACLIVSFNALNQMTDAANQAFEAVIQAASVEATGGDGQVVIETARKHQDYLAAISTKNRMIILIIGAASVFVVVVMSFILVSSLRSALQQETIIGNQAVPPEYWSSK